MNNSDFKTRIIYIGAIFFIVLLAICGRFFFVQIYRHEELYTKARAIYTRVLKSTGQRGEIYDVSGSLLAGNIPCVNLVADPSIMKDEEKCKEIAKIISQILEIPEENILKKIMTKERNGRVMRYAMLQRNVSLEDSKRLKNAIGRDLSKGLFFNETTKRYYPKDSLLAQTIGFVNIDRDVVVPVIGLEKVANQAVSSEVGVVKSERDRKGRSLSYGFSEIDESHNGKNIYLTIDEQIQIIVEEELDKLYKKFNPKAAYAIMVNPQNGNILAMAQRPTFNLNDRTSMTPKAWQNRMASDVFEPGSTMKSVVIASALDYNIVRPNTKFYCENGYWREMRLRDSHRMKDATVSHILSESSNVGTAKIAIKMGKNLLYKTF